MNPRTKALITVGLVITILTLFFLFIFIRQQKHTLSNAVYSEQHSLQKQMQLLIGQNSQRYRSRIKSLVTNRLQIINAFAEKDRNETFKHAYKLLELFQKENPYFRSFFFVNADNTVFLRVHRPDLYGDDISDLSSVTKEGNQIKDMVSGFEIIKGGLQYRIVCPIFKNKNYIGLVGFGINADLFIDQLRQIHHTYFHRDCKEETHIALVFPKAELYKSVFLDRPHKIIGKYVVIFNNDSLFQKLPDHVDLEKGLQQLKLNGLTHALIQGINFKGLKNNVIAEGFSLVNIENVITETKNTIMLTIIIYIILLFIAFTIIYLNFNLLFKKIAGLYNSLEQNNKELEHRIEERTVELQQEINEHKLAEQEKIKLETKLRQAQKMESIGTLAGGIAHDFNNILFPIMGHTEMLMSDIPEDSPFKERLDKIYTSAIRARDLVSQILIFARQESNELKPMKMQPIIKETLKLLRSTIPTTIDITHYIQTDSCVVKADPTQIHQIIMNLATNAWHAMEEKGGKLKVRLKTIILTKQDFVNPNLEPGKYALLTVADTGVGMSKEIIEKIFDPF
ncbi:MAG: hypothetical protein KAJ62_05610, partial [Desulfobacteraceae bacterium]|nr:hypothetical protein [Desulfobacteraceae bacterium]